MANFPKKTFQGVTYDFLHLDPFFKTISLDAKGTAHAALHVSFSIHCFTEEFDQAVHITHHTYTGHWGSGLALQHFHSPALANEFALPSQ